MSETPAIRLQGVGKLYRVFSRPAETVLDAVGLGAVLRLRGIEPRMFWSLRGVDLEIQKGRRLGIIGRNGAGKSTLLKVISGAISASEGEVDVRGRVQALFEAGSGFHPEFTGYENIRAALTYQGLTNDEIERAASDIAEFTELEQFLAQPIKTYSLGMQARLAFAVATSARPDILIVDEVLGAGDAYFAAKSTERMQQLVQHSGATVIIVSHALDQIMRYCDECIWLDRGRVAMRGRTLDVVNAYERFIQALDERRMLLRNRRRGPEGGAFEDHREALVVALRVVGDAGVDVGRVTLSARGGSVEEIRVGDVQDVSPGSSASVMLESSSWSEPRDDRGASFRTVTVPARGQAMGHLVFYALGEFEPGEYELRLRVRPRGGARLLATVTLRGQAIVSDMPVTDGAAQADWHEWTVPLLIDRAASPLEETVGGAQWSGDRSITISHTEIVGDDGASKAVFRAGEKLTVRTTLQAHRSGTFRLVVGATLARMDGILVTNAISPVLPATLDDEEEVRVDLDWDQLNLGDGRYHITVSVFEERVSDQTRYDLLARALEFGVVGGDSIRGQAIFDHPSQWSMTPRGAPLDAALSGG